MYEENDNQNSLGFLSGVLVGSVAGAVAMLLLAPQSGRATRTEMWEKGIELRDQTTGMVSNMRSGAKKMKHDGLKTFKDLKHQGREMAVDQIDRVKDVVKNA